MLSLIFSSLLGKRLRAYMTEEIELDDGTKTTRSKQSGMITSMDR